MMNRIAGRQNDRAARSERETDQSLSGNFQVRSAIGCDFHNSTRAGERSSHIEIPIRVECQSLRSPQSFVKRGDGTARIDLEYAIVWTCHEQVPVRTECQVISRDAHLQGGEHEHLLISGNFENRPVAVADVETLLAVKGNTGSDAQPLGEGSL